jgi:hypothetical protein
VVKRWCALLAVVGSTALACDAILDVDHTYTTDSGSAADAETVRSPQFACGNTVCNAPDQICCEPTNAPAICVPPDAACGGGKTACRSAANCPSSDVCCETDPYAQVTCGVYFGCQLAQNYRSTDCRSASGCINSQSPYSSLSELCDPADDAGCTAPHTCQAITPCSAACATQMYGCTINGNCLAKIAPIHLCY